MSGADPLETAGASDEVIDAIAEIEMERRETEKKAGLAKSCGLALHRLRELLAHETDALRLRGPDSGHQENVQAVTNAIGRVNGLSAIKGQKPNSFPGQARTGPQQVSWRNAPQNPARNTGRRTMGRAGGR